VAPLSFRKAVTHALVSVDVQPADLTAEVVRLDLAVTLKNVLDKPVDIEVHLADFEGTRWSVGEGAESGWTLKDGNLTLTRQVTTDSSVTVHLPVRVPQAKLSFPPDVGWRVQYDGAWLDKEGMRMVEVTTAPIHPVSSYTAPEEVMLVGPFALGHIDTSPLPGAPEQANAKFFHRFGPEEGYQEGATYEGGLEWQRVQPLGVGLVNGNSLLGTLDHVAAYVSCAVYSPVAQTTHAVVTADNFSQTFVNGELVEDGQDFGAPGDFVYPKLVLKEGWNSVVVKLINNRADWFLRLLVADPMGNLEISAE